MSTRADNSTLALGAADFRWIASSEARAYELGVDVPTFNAAARRAIEERFAGLREQSGEGPELGVPLLGPSGAGKTHLLCALGERALEAGEFCVWVDWADPRGLDVALLDGALRSLAQAPLGARPPRSHDQLARLLGGLLDRYAPLELRQLGVSGLRRLRPPGLILRWNEIVASLEQAHGSDAIAHRDVLRALGLLACDATDIAELGATWLSGGALAPSEAELHGFHSRAEQPTRIADGLFWLLSLVAPTLLVLDAHSDAEAAPAPRLRSEPPSSRAEPRGAGSALTVPDELPAALESALDGLPRTLIVFSATERAWQNLVARAGAIRERFEPPLSMKPLGTYDTARELIERRLAPLLRNVGEGLPAVFDDAFFRSAVGRTPRELLKRCEAFRRQWSIAARSTEASPSGPPASARATSSATAPSATVPSAPAPSAAPPRPLSSPVDASSSRPPASVPRPESGPIMSVRAVPRSNTLQTSVPPPASGARSRPGVAPRKDTIRTSVPPPSPRPPALSLPIGQRVVGTQLTEAVALPMANLRKHTVVLAGAGAGKTMLLKRIIEEAVLAGVPSIVVDSGNALSLLGDRWPEEPASFTDKDRKKAERYHATADVVIWTPGIATGNPVTLNPIPDFDLLSNEPEETKSAIHMVASSLAPIVAGRGHTAPLRLAVLTKALEYFAARGGRKLSDLIELLRDLPPGAYRGFGDGDRNGKQMAELLSAATVKNPLFGGPGLELDPSLLLASDRPGRVRVSVLNLSGLDGIEAKQQFMDHLSVALFTFLRQNPAREELPLGLLVIDEVAAYVPSGGAVRGKDNLLRLLGQGRKYGLGLVFATRAPKSIDPNVIASAGTHIYGKALAPAAALAIAEQLQRHDGDEHGVEALAPGTFYFHTAGMQAPVKVRAPLSLSAHPQGAPDVMQITERARASARTSPRLPRVAPAANMR